MSIRPASLLVWRMLQTRPRRTLMLLLGYGLGVAVMVALLAVGDALLVQAQDKDVVSGGDVVLLPEGIDPEVLKVGGVTGMFLAIPNARYLVRQVLLGPRFEEAIAAVSPEITDKLVYVRTRGRVAAALGSADVPALARATRSALAIASPAWTDTAQDRAWVTPDLAALLKDTDHFHVPISGALGRSWAEWWYFNFATTDGLYGYLRFSADQTRTALVTVSLRLPGGRLVRWMEQHPAAVLPLDGSRFQAGAQSVVLREGTYAIHLSRGDFSAELQVLPIPGLDFPPLERQAGTFRSGYVVPALRAKARGVVRVGREQFVIDGVGYHDHNWGVWEAVTWEWGTASNADLALLAGVIHHPALRGQDMFVSLYGVGNAHPGLLAAFRATRPTLDQWRPGPRRGIGPLTVPGRLRYQAINDAGDRLDVQIIVEDVLATPMEGHIFLQIRGRYRLEGQVDHRSVIVEMAGFAETFLPAPRSP